MRSTVIWSFLSVVALSVGGLLSGCDSDATIAKSGVGESCDSSADCNDDLKCLQGACYKVLPPSGGDAGADGGGGTTSGPPAPVLGDEGESCTKRADCKEGLGCYNQRCIAAPTGDGGEGNIPGSPVLGKQGETCGLTSDCDEGLACLPTGGAITVQAIGSNSVGVCTPLDSGLKPSGKTCGHECVEAADCCELPVAQHALLGAYSCADLAVLVADVANCSTATGVDGARCLAFDSYCDDQCGAKTWACEAGACQYTAKCTKAGEVVGGCPAYTRGGRTVPACDVDEGACTGPVVTVVGCTTDESCFEDAATVYDRGDTCSEGECACDVPTGRCYAKCSEPTDCAAGYTCSDETSLCVPVGSCTSDIHCVLQYGDSRATCVEGTCQNSTCEHDIDCNPGGLTDGYFSSVCVEGACVSLVGQCETDDECPAYAGSTVRSFCATPVAGEPTVTPVSAITD